MLLVMIYGIFLFAATGIICLFTRKRKKLGLYLFKSACGVFALIAVGLCYYFSLASINTSINEGLHPESHVAGRALVALVAACCVFLVSQFPFLIIQKSFFPKGRKLILVCEGIVYFFVWLGGAALLYSGLTDECHTGYDGNAVVRKINGFKKNEGRLPDGLEDVGLEKSPEGNYVYRNGTFYYRKEENDGYILYYKGEEPWMEYQYESRTDEWREW